MRSSLNNKSIDPFSSAPLSLFPNSTATQNSFISMKEGAQLHHDSVINKVMNSDPIKDFITAKESTALNEGSSSSKALVEAANLRLPNILSSPCSPQSCLRTPSTPIPSPFLLQNNMALMHLSPLLMERLEADLATLQQKYGLSQSITTGHAQLDAAHEQAELPISKQVAMNTFVSPLRHNFNNVLSSEVDDLDNPSLVNSPPLPLPPPSSSYGAPPSNGISSNAQPNGCTEGVRGNAKLTDTQSAHCNPISWAARLGGSRSTSSTPLSYIPPTVVEGVPSVFITSDEFKDELEECGKLVVGYFIGKRLPLHIVRTQVDQHWDLKGLFNIECRGDKCFYFRFGCEEDRLMVLERGMLHIASRLFVLRKWSARVEEDVVSLNGNEEAYTPQMVSIGPFHRGCKNLQAMELHKLRYLNDFLNRCSGMKLELFIDSLRKLEEKARQCYGEPISLTRDEFIEMMLIAVALSLSYFLRCVLRKTEIRYRHRF